MDDFFEKFSQFKDDIINNLNTLHYLLSTCIELGMIDEDNNIYNQISTLIEEVTNTDTIEELSEFITQGQKIELIIDSYLTSKGESTISLSWPTFE